MPIIPTPGACASCGGDGGGGGPAENVNVLNFPANQNVTVTNCPDCPPQDVNVLNFPANQDVTVTNNPRSADGLVLCDDNGPFLRSITYDQDGNFLGVTDTDLLGNPYNPVSVPTVCSTPAVVERDEEVAVLCDDNGPFLRRYIFDATTGALIGAAIDTLLDGTTAYATVGTVVVCGPDATYGGPTAQEIADAIAAEDLLVHEAPANLNAQHRLLNAGDVWNTNVDPTLGTTLTSLTYTILSGTADVNDRDGTPANGLPAGLSVTWAAEDKNALFGAQTITAVGGQVYVHWTERA